MKKKNGGSTVLLVIMFIAGFCLMAYPTVADRWNQSHATRAIASYEEVVASRDTTENDDMLQAAREWNAHLGEFSESFELPEDKIAEYNDILNVSGTGIMSYLTIPKIEVTQPVYHGTGESVLQVAIGHVNGTSLPVGGLGTHCVLSGHRGLPSAKLLSDLDKIVEGDVFLLRTVNETLTYEVDQIRIVLPYELDDIKPVEGKDYCTLVTCTPYGVNTHRLLVRGHRIATAEDDTVYVPNEAVRIDPVLVAPAVAVPILIALLLWLIFKTRKRA